MSASGASSDIYRRIVDSSSDCIKIVDLDGKLVFMNEGGMRVMEIDDFAKFDGCPWLQFWNGPHFLDAQLAVEAAKQGEMGRFTGAAPTAKGNPRWWDVRVSPIFGADGKVESLLSVSRDISASHEVSEAAEVANVQLRKDFRDQTAELARSSENLTQSRSDLAQSREDLIRSTDDLAQSTAALAGEKTQRIAAEDKVRQMQKMEAIGQLTGGIAHDFNNMLAVIIAGNNLIERRAAKGEDVTTLVESVSEAAHRAAALTNRLLAFSRQLPLAPEPVNANQLISTTAELMRRTLGEAVQLETVLSGGLWQAHADINQLESAILNLAINARDAMPDGGKLTIETQNSHLDDAYARAHIEVDAGQYVLIAVTDTGTGMSQEVIDRAFEPFFTTKGVGKGTGLGLSQVYGFGKQSKGHVKIYSELGKGTTVKLYLPRFYGEQQRPADKSFPRQSPTGSKEQIILLVEDETRIREITAESLRELGYSVVPVHSGAAALDVLRGRDDIGLLFTDIVMPEMNGRELADEAVKLNPDLRVLFTTGYTRNAIVHNNMLDPGVNFLAKPYTLDQLAMKVREVFE